MCQHSVVILVCKSSFRETAVSCCIEYFKFKSLFFFKSHLSKCVCCVQLCLVWLNLFCIVSGHCNVIYVYFFPVENYCCFNVFFYFIDPHMTWKSCICFNVGNIVVNELLAWLSPVLVLFLLKIDSDSC